jgi:hypothetical protein
MRTDKFTGKSPCGSVDTIVPVSEWAADLLIGRGSSRRI